MQLISSIPTSEYHRAIYDLPAHWIRCSEPDSDYFEWLRIKSNFCDKWHIPVTEVDSILDE